MIGSSARRRLVLGTAGLGMAYGVRDRGAVEPDGARALVREALQAGVRCFDTAPAYGAAERLVGGAVGNEGEIWTKLTAEGVEQALSSVAASLDACGRERLDLVQWHNWTAEQLRSPGWVAAHQALLASPRVRRVGASTYGVADALAAVESGAFALVQVEWNLLNQAVVRGVGERAQRCGVALAARSVLLQGVLADTHVPLPPRLTPLEDLRSEAGRVAAAAGQSLQELALRAALATPELDHVLFGAQSTPELEDALAAADAPPLGPVLLARCRALDRSDSTWTDPRRWPR